MANRSRQLRGRMRAVQNTRKITRTMELVATSKLKRAQDRVAAARPYAEALREVIVDLLTPELMLQFPLLRQPAPPSKGGPKVMSLILATSNRGLCGAFNSNLIKEARRRIAELEEKGYTVALSCVGKKGAGYFKYIGRKLALDRQDVGDKPTVEHARSIVEPLIREYEAGRLAGVEMVHAKFQSAMSTPATITQVLPVVATTRKGSRPDYILEPGPDEIVAQLLPLYVRNTVYRGMVETAAGEHGARRTAMKNATDNAGDLLDNLRRAYNRGRQAQITQEIAEIVGGAAALQG